jgi:hypothetical protein
LTRTDEGDEPTGLKQMSSARRPRARQNVPYPGFSPPAGLVTSAARIVLGAGGLFALMRRRGRL